MEFLLARVTKHPRCEHERNHDAPRGAPFVRGRGDRDEVVARQIAGSGALRRAGRATDLVRIRPATGLSTLEMPYCMEDPRVVATAAVRDPRS